MKRSLSFFAGLSIYLVFLGAFLHVIGFIVDVFTLDAFDALQAPDPATNEILDCALFLAIAMQHRISLQQSFRRWMRGFSAQQPSRDNGVLPTGLALGALGALGIALVTPLALRLPSGDTVWSVSGEASFMLSAVQALGWLLVAIGTLRINDYDFFGQRKLRRLLSSVSTHQPSGVTTQFAHRLLHRPLYLGWLLSVWATPTMNLPHLLLAGITTFYVLRAIQAELQIQAGGTAPPTLRHLAAKTGRAK